MTMKNNNVQGECPNCGSVNLDYVAIVPQDEWIYYPFTCNDCGCEGKECYSLTFESIEKNEK